MKLVSNVVQSFKVAKVFSPNTDRINSIDHFKDGKTLVSSSDDDSIVIYDCEKGTQSQTLHSKKYGADFIRFTQANDSAIHSSNKVDDTIRYLSLHDNKYIRYFPGHTKKVVSLSMSPCDNTFLSGSLDKSVRLWDLRSPNCQGYLSLSGRTVVNYDPVGLVFAVGVDGECVKLYDQRTFDKGPFNSFNLPKTEAHNWATGVKFSPDSKSLLVSTSSSIIYLIDAYQGVSLQTFEGYSNTKGVPLEASFSPDSQFIFSGSTSGAIHVWRAENGVKTTVLQCDHNGPIHCVQFNPKFMMLVSACTTMAFWLPSVADDDL